MANIKKLKRREIRKVVPLFLDDETINIEVYNLSASKKEELYEVIRGSINMGEAELDVQDAHVAEIIYRTLTNIEFDTAEELAEVLADPCYELAVVAQEVTACILELVKEQLHQKYLELENLEAMGTASRTMARAMELERQYTVEEEVIAEEVILDGEESI